MLIDVVVQRSQNAFQEVQLPPYNDEAGDWQELDSPRQVPRYVAIADILRSFSANSDVLDVGCGDIFYNLKLTHLYNLKLTHLVDKLFT
jgi:hypothetical protein